MKRKKMKPMLGWCVVLDEFNGVARAECCYDYRATAVHVLGDRKGRVARVEIREVPRKKPARKP